MRTPISRLRAQVMTPPLPVQETDESAEGGGSRQLHRSPNFPFISLQKAIERAEQLHSKEGRHQVRLDVVAKHWEYALKSSGLLQTVGALRMFGLLNVEAGTGHARLLRLTERAIRILLDKRVEEKTKALQEAALAPSLYADLWKLWGPTMPSEANAISHLTVDLGFNPSSAPAVFAAYKDTVAYAGLNDRGKLSGESGDRVTPPAEEPEDMNDAINDPVRVSQQEPAIRTAGTTSAPVAKGDELLFLVKLAGGRSARVVFQGGNPSQADLKKLIDNIQLNMDAYPEKPPTIS